MPPADEVDYQRGSGGVRIDTRRLVLVILGLVILVMATLVVVTAIDAAQHNSRVSRLQQRGVPVDVTVTSCLGLASGTGITVDGFQCRGTFALEGHTYNEVIGGSSVNIPPGTTVHAVVVPREPSSLSTKATAASKDAAWKSYLTAGVLLLITILLTVGWLLLRARWRRPVAPSDQAPDHILGKPAPRSASAQAYE
jgi:hypothetical protein